MIVIKPSVGEFIQKDLYEHIERCGRICYKSEHKIEEGSAKPFVQMLTKRGHGSVLEHGTVYLVVPFGEEYTEHNFLQLLNNKYTKHREFGNNYYITTNFRVIYENNFSNLMTKYWSEPTDEHYKRRTFKMVCNRSTSHEFVRHRVMSVSQESQRYVNYGKEKFGKNIKFIKPLYFDETSKKYLLWKINCMDSEDIYMRLLSYGCSPQEAREVLPNSTATTLVMTGFESEWQDFFELRCSKAAHPQAEEVANMIRDLF
jgi:thymidylate synthase (FAD)